jgi:cyclopropane fatty-acyl-phospholipid synthase-like methyltransferase
VAFSEKQIARYYDVNTESFLRYGQGGELGVMHRAVWGPGITSRKDAFTFVNVQLAKQAASLPGDHPVLLDLGCGIGATLVDLVDRTGGQGIGVTNSQVQFELARQYQQRKDSKTTRTKFLFGDFCHLELNTEIDLAYAIESFVLTPNPKRFFATLCQCLRRGGQLVICDDFLSEEIQRDTLAEHERQWLDEFEQGWCINTLMKPSETDRLAEEYGLRLIDDRDLSCMLDLERFRDVVIQALVALGRNLPLKHPRWMNLLGGNALQQCLKSGLIQYRLRTWKK